MPLQVERDAEPGEDHQADRPFHAIRDPQSPSRGRRPVHALPSRPLVTERYRRELSPCTGLHDQSAKDHRRFVTIEEHRARPAPRICARSTPYLGFFSRGDRADVLSIDAEDLEEVRERSLAIADHSNDEPVVRVAQPVSRRPDEPSRSARGANSLSARDVKDRLASKDSDPSFEQGRTQERDPHPASFRVRHAPQSA